ncbi:MAG: polysaccharide deacetylase family protein [Candidatus Rokuibacteriota bacterium]
MRISAGARFREVLARLRDWLCPPAIVLMYHRVSPVSRDPWQLAVTPAHFAEHLEVVRHHGRPVAIRSLTHALAAGRTPGPAVAITLDDGYADNLLHARPLLERHDAPATVFVAAGCLGRSGFWWDELERIILTPVHLPEHLRLVVRGEVHAWGLGAGTHYPLEAQARDAAWPAWTDPPTGRHRLFVALYRLLRPLTDSERHQALAELDAWAGVTASPRSPARPLTPPEVSRLAAGGLVEIGAHTLTHAQLSGLDREAQRREIRGSRRALEELAGDQVVSFAYPYGTRSDYTPETVALVQEAGFAGACAGVPGPVRRGTPLFEVPRFHVQDCDGDGLARRLAAWVTAAG